MLTANAITTMVSASVSEDGRVIPVKSERVKMVAGTANASTLDASVIQAGKVPFATSSLIAKEPGIPIPKHASALLTKKDSNATNPAALVTAATTESAMFPTADALALPVTEVQTVH